MSPNVRSSTKTYARRNVDDDIGALFQNRERTGHEPAALGGGGERLFAEPLRIGRVGEEKLKRLQIADGAEIGGIAAQDAGAAGKAERLDVFPEKPATLDAVFDEEDVSAAARGGLQADRAGSGKDVHHPGAVDSLWICMRQDVEQALARAVRRRPDRIGLRNG